jgi:hypothetical protein
MARVARAEVFHPREVSVFHCLNRCVRRCFLCGQDAVSGKDYEYRKAWLEERLAFLAGNFGIDVLGFSIMSTHFHVILRNRPDVVETWSDEEAARRWWQVCPARKTESGEPEEPTTAELAAISGNPQRLAEIRLRLSDISWFMRQVAEPVARRANREDGCTGRFWQGRFKAVKLCDEAALLACSVYVDLNPLRAGCAATPEESEHTSARRRIEELAQGTCDNPASAQADSTAEPRPPADWLAPLPLDERAAPGPAPSALATRASDKGFLPLPLADYLDLLDWTGRQAARGKAGTVPAHLAPILERLDIPAEAWLELSLGFGKVFHHVAGCSASIARECSRARRRYRAPGARLLRPLRVRRE